MKCPLSREDLRGKTRPAREIQKASDVFDLLARRVGPWKTSSKRLLKMVPANAPTLMYALTFCEFGEGKMMGPSLGHLFAVTDEGRVSYMDGGLPVSFCPEIKADQLQMQWLADRGLDTILEGLFSLSTMTAARRAGLGRLQKRPQLKQATTPEHYQLAVAGLANELDRSGEARTMGLRHALQECAPLIRGER